MENEQYPILSDDKALILTKSIIGKIEKLKPELRVFGFYAWQSIITALAMQIDAENAIHQINQKLKLPRADIVTLVELKTYHEKVKMEAEYNYQQFNDWLLANNVSI